jgi:putative transposase
LGQLTTLIEQKAVVNGREFIEIAPKDIPDEPRQRAERYSKQLRLPRAVYLSSFFGRYRAWSWESKPGESQWTLNQEAAQVATLRDAETTSKSSSQPSPECESVGASQVTSSVNAFKQQQPNLSSSVNKSTRATSQGLSEAESQITASSEDKASRQQKKAQKRKATPPTATTQAEERKRCTRKDDFS